MKLPSTQLLRYFPFSNLHSNDISRRRARAFFPVSFNELVSFLLFFFHPKILIYGFSLRLVRRYRAQKTGLCARFHSSGTRARMSTLFVLFLCTAVRVNAIYPFNAFLLRIRASRQIRLLRFLNEIWVRSFHATSQWCRHFDFYDVGGLSTHWTLGNDLEIFCRLIFSQVESNSFQRFEIGENY